MSGDEREIQPAPPPAPDCPGIISSNLSESESSFNGLSKQEQSRLIILSERYVVVESARENNRHREEKGRQNLALASLIAFVVIVLSAFAYSGMTKDQILSEKVINTMLGVFGGGGAAVAFVRKQS